MQARIILNEMARYTWAGFAVWAMFELIQNRLATCVGLLVGAGLLSPVYLELQTLYLRRVRQSRLFTGLAFLPIMAIPILYGLISGQWDKSVTICIIIAGAGLCSIRIVRRS